MGDFTEGSEGNEELRILDFGLGIADCGLKRKILNRR
jgi:hypothetical protein